MERKPIVTRAFVVATVALAVAALRRAGVGVSDDVAGQLVEVFAVLAPLGLAYWAQRHTTPTSDPRDHDGTPLVRVDQVDKPDA